MVAGEKGEKTTGNIGKVVLLLPVLNACLMTPYLLPAVVVGAWLQSGHGDNVLTPPPPPTRPAPANRYF